MFYPNRHNHTRPELSSFFSNVDHVSLGTHYSFTIPLFSLGCNILKKSVVLKLVPLVLSNDINPQNAPKSDINPKNNVEGNEK